jgi:isoquinoline 1-oxidoreductase subunit beta
MNGILKMTRRNLLKSGVLIGSGLVLGIRLHEKQAWAARPKEFFAPNAFLHIGTDGLVTFFVNKSEMGQGVYTSLPMLIAEELPLDLTKIRVEAAPVDPAYNHTQWGMQATGGSTSVRSEWDRLRMAGATARLMLTAAAAKIWGVNPAGCHAEKGFVIHTGSRQRLSYGKLAAAAARQKQPIKVPLKQPKDFVLIGKPVKRVDTPEKTNGGAVFGIDAEAPGMLVAVIARPPVFGGKVKSINDNKAKKIPGVKAVIQIPSGVAVAADGFWAAQQGRAALTIDWDEGSLAGLSTEQLRAQYQDLAHTAGTVARRQGEPAADVIALADRRISALYEVPYLAHAPMEPLNCLVDLRRGRCRLWTGTQSQTANRDAAAAVAGLTPENVELTTLLLGGGFGRRGNPHSDFVVEAVHTAKALGQPVKVIWPREDDIRGGYYRPLWYDKLSAGLDGQGRITGWQHTIVGQSIMAGTAFAERIQNGIDPASVEGAADIPYEVPNILVDLHSPQTGIPVQWWRSVGHSHTAFVVESFMDEVARLASKDPFEFRRTLLAGHPRHLGVLELAAKKAGWGAALPEGRGRGIAVHESFGSFVAEVAEVSVEGSGAVRVHRVVCAVDCGRVVNPDIIAAQMEGGIVYGLTAALFGEITFKNGRVQQGNFNDYPMLRMGQEPQVEVHIVESAEAPGGIGEPGVPPIAPAVANAVLAATGWPVRRLPLRSSDLKKM